MGLFDQVVLSIYTIGLTVLSLLLIVMAFGWSQPLSWLEQALVSPNVRWALGVIGALFFVTGLRLLRVFTWRRGSGEALVRQTDLGEVQVTLAAVEDFVARVGRQVEGVRELRARVGTGASGVRVQLRASVGSNVHVPGLAERLAATIKEQVRRVVGVDVEQVRTLIDNIDGDARRRRVE